MAQFSNVIIHGGTINSAQGDLHINTRDLEVGLHTLRLASSLGAIHDSAERCPPPNCHPDTRKAVRQIILDWIHDDSAASPFFWLYGSPGVGKTAILQAIAEWLCSPSGRNEIFGGSFFFSRGKSGRDQGHFLFSTLAYQLAIKVPGLRQHVNRIMEKNPELHTKSMAVQLQSLIIDSFQCLSPLPQRSYLVIIDGLDECRDKTTQQSILQLLCEMITVHKSPLRILIGSRPESHIRDSFDQECLYTVTRRVVLDKTFDPGRDIEVFLRDGFAKICAKNSILSYVKQPWPDQGIIDLLVQRSSGQFIYAATVLKFVGADFCSPTKQLGLILKPDPSAFSDLDNLYTQILSIYPSTVNIVQVLGIIIAFDERTLTPEVIEDILGMEEGELKVVLRGMSSVIAFEGDKDGEYLTGKVTSNVGRPYFSHASFGDYLRDPSRSGPFYVNSQEYEHKATIWSFSLITTSIRESGRISSTQVPHRATWHYFKSYLPAHFMRCPKVVKDAIATDINDLMQQFWRASTDGVDIFCPAMCRLREILQILLNRWKHPVGDVHENHFLTEKFFDQLFSKSGYLSNLIRFLPGIVVQKSLTMQGMVDLYDGVTLDLLKYLISSVDPPTPFQECFDSRYMLDDHLSRFLQDRERSDLYYCDPMLHHIFICRHFLSLLRGSAPFPSFHSYDELSGYARHHFYDHLCAATEVFLTGQKISSDHPAVGIFNDLESTTYDYVDPTLPGYKFVRWIIHPILKWADMLNSPLKGTAVSIPNVDVIERVHLLTKKIYQEILCIERYGSMMIVTPKEFGPSQVYTYSRPPQYKIQLSWVSILRMLVEDRIPSSFTHFITTPELSGPLYISPDDYHTQITEYSLEAIFRYQNSIPDIGSPLQFPAWHFGEHLSRALPTEMILYLLRSIDLQRLQLHDYSPKSMLDFLETVIKWLEGLGSERPSDLSQRFLHQLELLQPTSTQT